MPSFPQLLLLRAFELVSKGWAEATRTGSKLVLRPTFAFAILAAPWLNRAFPLARISLSFVISYPSSFPDLCFESTPHDEYAGFVESFDSRNSWRCHDRFRFRSVSAVNPIFPNFIHARDLSGLSIGCFHTDFPVRSYSTDSFDFVQMSAPSYIVNGAANWLRENV